MASPNSSPKNPPLELRLQILSAVDYAPGKSIRERIKNVAQRTFVDQQSGIEYQFTWRTISTWLYRFKKYGITSLDTKTRSDKNSYRKVQANELAEAINEVVPTLSNNKTGTIPKSTLYRLLIKRGFFQRSQLSPTSFYRMVRENNLLDLKTTQSCVCHSRCSLPMSFGRRIPCTAPPLSRPTASGRRLF